MPNKEDVYEAIIGLNRNSAYGLYGMIGALYKDVWEIVGDIYKRVQYLFSGAELPRFITHTTLGLVPKKVMVNKFSNLRPISLKILVIKIFTRIIHENCRRGKEIYYHIEEAQY